MCVSACVRQRLGGWQLIGLFELGGRLNYAAYTDTHTLGIGMCVWMCAVRVCKDLHYARCIQAKIAC